MLILFNYFRINDRLKNNLIEALSRKGAALCQLNYHSNNLNIIKDDENDKALKTIDEIWLLVTCFISPDSDVKVCFDTWIIQLEMSIKSLNVCNVV